MNAHRQIRRFQIYRVTSLVAGVLILFASPLFMIWNWIGIVWFVVVFALFARAATLQGNLASGTQYGIFGRSQLNGLGSSETTLAVSKFVSVILIVGMVLGSWVKRPDWWVTLFDRGLIVGIALSFFLFCAASIYETAISLTRAGAYKRCSNDHRFSPFETMCPKCTAKKNLYLVLEPKSADEPPCCGDDDTSFYL